MNGVVAAGHPLTAERGAEVLRAGGNAVDAAIAACLASWPAEPLLTGPAAGGYMLVAGRGIEPVLLDFFVAAPTPGECAELTPVEVSFGDAVQEFHVGAASVGVPGVLAGLEQAAQRWGSVPLAELAASAARNARDGVPSAPMQAYVAAILEPIVTMTPAIAALFAPGGRVLREGELFRAPELGDTIERFGAEGAEPFYRSEVAAAIAACVGEHGGTLTAADLGAYAAVAREPVTLDYHGRTVLTNPPPSAGGILLALALGRLRELGAGTGPQALLAAMAGAQDARTADFDERLGDPGFLERFLAANLGSTTHISVLDAGGLACSVTCSNGEGSGIVVPGTGIHLNNMMGEEDLNPQGFFRAPAGRRMPSMMAPTVVLGEDGEVELVLGSAGSNRIRSALLQTIVRTVDGGADAEQAVNAPRLHLEGETVYAEPGALPQGFGLGPGLRPALFRDRNLFFGGVQAIRRDPRTGVISAAGDPRRGGAVAWA